MKTNTRKLVLSALFLALGVLLPQAFHLLPEGGTVLSPMHIPALLCGFVCGWQYGAVVGLLSPLLSSLFVQMPPMGSPYFFSMMPELLCYGLLAGLLYRLLPKTAIGLYAALVLAMLGGRAVWGLAMWLVMLSKGGFTLQAFWAGAFAKAVPAIILHIVAIPPMVLALRRARLMTDV